MKLLLSKFFAAKAQKEIDKLAKADVTSEVFTEYDEQFHILAWLTLLFLVVDILILPGKSRITRNFNLFGNDLAVQCTVITQLRTRLETQVTKLWGSYCRRAPACLRGWWGEGGGGQRDDEEGKETQEPDEAIVFEEGKDVAFDTAPELEDAYYQENVFPLIDLQRNVRTNKLKFKGMLDSANDLMRSLYPFAGLILLVGVLAYAFLA